MSKTITSPVKRYPGHVVLSDPLTFPQTFAFEDSIKAVDEARESGSVSRIRYALLSGILACVEEWHIEGGFPAQPALDNFPSTPRQSSADLIEWITGEIGALYREADDVPLA